MPKNVPGQADHAAPTERITVSRDFTIDTVERAVKTFAQALLAYFGAGALNVLSADWGEALSVGGGAAVISLLTSLLSFKLGRSGTASATDAVVPESQFDALARGLGDAGLANGPRG